MPKYENSVIYKIKHNEDYDDNNIYVGSTSNFKNRKYKHKDNCNNENREKYNLPVYQYIRDNGGWDNWVMIPIEQYPCNSKEEKLIRERHHIDLLRPTLNKNIPGRTKKEYYLDNKERIAERDKKIYEANKEKILERNKKYYESNTEKIKQYKKEYNKQYLEDNKEKLAEIKKKWAEANKEKIKEYQKEYGNKKVICDNCGSEVNKINLKRHQKSKKCLKLQKQYITW